MTEIKKVNYSHVGIRLNLNKYKNNIIGNILIETVML